MIDPQELNKKTDALMGLLKAKIGAGGKTLEARMARIGRRLPKRLHGEAKIIIKAQEVSPHPKLASTIDAARVDSAFEAITNHLKQLDPKDRRKGKLLGWMGYQVFNLILISAALIGVLVWRGYLG